MFFQVVLTMMPSQIRSPSGIPPGRDARIKVDLPEARGPADHDLLALVRPSGRRPSGHWNDRTTLFRFWIWMTGSVEA